RLRILEPRCDLAEDTTHAVCSPITLKEQVRVSPRRRPSWDTEEYARLAACQGKVVRFSDRDSVRSVAELLGQHRALIGRQHLGLRAALAQELRAEDRRHV